MDPLSPEQTSAYLTRLGVREKPCADFATLCSLIEAHLQRVTFENIDVLLHRMIEIDADSLFDKIIGRGRGGYCFELNSLFARLLQALGYRLRLRMARVRWGVPLDAPLTLKQHLVPIVELAEGEYLVDVGFGSANPYLPLPLVEQGSSSANHPYTLRSLGAETDCEPGTLELCIRGRDGWIPMYRIEPRDQRWRDCMPLNWYVSTHPQSIMRRMLLVGRTDGEAWLSLNNGRYRRRLRRAGYEAVEKRDIRDAEELLAVLQNEFHVPLCPENDVELLKARLATLVLEDVPF
uniref:arylamine N-acetyltransferase n=1 Tax=Amblyomma maculatum TaxID=34609 RepID=G3ML93_AMBMU